MSVSQKIGQLKTTTRPNRLESLNFSPSVHEFEIRPNAISSAMRSWDHLETFLFRTFFAPANGLACTCINDH